MELVARSMEEGAWGSSRASRAAGPSIPRKCSSMAKIVATLRRQLHVAHRQRRYEQTKEFDFAIRVADEAKMPVHIFHFKIRGVPLWGTIDKYIAQIEGARARGLDITANQYPYTAMFHGWSAFFPLWIREGGPAKFAERLKDPASRARLKTDKDFITWAKEHGWWDGIALARAAHREEPPVRGQAHRRDRQAARRRGPDGHVHRHSWRKRAAASAASSTRCPKTTCAR